MVAWLDASHRNPTPYFGRQDLESFARGASLASPAVSRPIAGLTRVRACARVRRKICISDKAGGPKPVAGRRLPTFYPPPVFARCRGSFLADWSLENAPFYPQKSPMSLKTKDSKKRKFLRFMKGTSQRRLPAGSPELSNPPPGSARCRGSFLRMGPR